MIELPFTPEMVAESRRLAKSMGSIKNSILSGGGNRAGFLGELALARFLGVERENERNFDLILNGKTIEVKSKRRLFDPHPSFEGSVALSSSHQHPSYYAFLSLTFESKCGKNYAGLKSVWLCGFISYSEFMEKSVVWEKGKIDKSNNFETLVNMRNIKYSDLYENISNDR